MSSVIVWYLERYHGIQTSGERFYNFDRPRTAHDGRTPYEALREKLS